MVSSWCIGLKSPEAPAYFTNIVRVSGGNSSVFSSPTLSASKRTAAVVAVTEPPRKRVDLSQKRDTGVSSAYPARGGPQREQRPPGRGLEAGADAEADLP